MLRGDRTADLEPQIRYLVHVARLVMHSREDLSPERREALKIRVLEQLDLAEKPTFRERWIAAWTVLARPAPLVFRAAALALVVALIGAGTTVAAAYSLPDDPLYGWKLATEQVRLTMAHSPVDRAAVELSIAEHRLDEATSLAQDSRDVEADAATANFGQHLASAAAALVDTAPVPTASLPFADQLRDRMVQQQHRFTERNDALNTTASAPALAALTEITKVVGSGKGVAAERIADAAARAAEDAAANAAKRAVTEDRGARAKGEHSQKLDQFVKAARESAERAREAAEKAKHDAATRADKDDD